MQSEVSKRKTALDKLDVDEQLRPLPIAKYRKNLKKRDKAEIIAIYKKQYEGNIEYDPIIIKPLLGMIATAVISVLVAKFMENPMELQGEGYVTIVLMVVILLPLLINVAMMIMGEVMDEERKQHPSFERWVQNQIVEELFCQYVGIQSTARKEK